MPVDVGLYEPPHKRPKRLLTTGANYTKSRFKKKQLRKFFLEQTARDRRKEKSNGYQIGGKFIERAIRDNVATFREIIGVAPCMENVDE